MSLKTHKSLEKFRYILHENEKLSEEEITKIYKQALIKCIIYARVSTDEQEYNYSLTSQILANFNKAKELWGVTEEECLVITESESGKIESRAGIQYAIQLMRKRIHIQYYIAHNLDRTARKLELQLKFHDIFSKNGINYQYVLFTVEDTPSGKLNESIQGAVAEYFRENLAITTERGKIEKLNQGQHIPIGRFYGYKYNTEKDIYEINKEEAKVIRLMVNLLMKEDYTRGEIKRELEKRKIIAPKGNIWYDTTITRILTNETIYTGIEYYRQTKVEMNEQEKKIQVAQPKERWFELFFGEIITDYSLENVIKKLNIKKNENTGRPSENYWVSKIVYCGRCGKKASKPVISYTKENTIRYYACSGKNVKGKDVITEEIIGKTCSGKNWRMDYVDKKVWDSLSKRLLDFDIVIEEILNQIKKENNNNNFSERLKEINKEITDTQTIIDNMVQAFFDPNNKMINTQEELERYKEMNVMKIQELNKEKAILESELKAVKNDQDVKQNLKKYIEKYKRIIEQNNIDVQTKKNIINIFIESITLHEDDTVIIKYKWGKDEKIWLEISKRTGVLEKNKGEINHDNKHVKDNPSQTYGEVFYVEVIETLDDTYIKDMETYKFADYLDQKEIIVKMYQQELMTYQEIGEALNIGYWLIEDIIDYLDIPKISLSERAKLKRAKDFDLIFDLHFNKQMSLNEIYRQYKFSPIYCKSVLADKGYKHQGFKNQLDLAESKQKLAPSPIDKKTQIKIAKRYAKGESSNILAKEYGVAKGTVIEYAKKHGYYDLKEEKRTKLEQNIIDDYVKKEMGISSIAKKYGYKSNTAIQKILEKHNIKTRPSPQQYIQMLRNGEINAPVYKKFYKMKQANMKLHIDKISDEDLFELVITEKVSSNEIGWLFGCGRTTVYSRREKCGLIHNQSKEKLKNLKKKA